MSECETNPVHNGVNYCKTCATCHECLAEQAAEIAENKADLVWLRADRIRLENQIARLREAVYDAYGLGQEDAMGDGTLAGIAYKDKAQVLAALEDS
jgi:hypothetical protein